MRIHGNEFFHIYLLTVSPGNMKIYLKFKLYVYRNVMHGNMKNNMRVEA